MTSELGPAGTGRRLVTEIPGPRSRALQARRTAAVSSAVATTLPVFVARAEGALIEDVDGNRLIDFAAGISVLNVGHTAPPVVAAAGEQLSRFTHSCFMVTPYEGYLAVCEALNRITPGEHRKKSMLVNSGAEAVENAVKVARAATGRSAVVVFEHSYHGRTLLTMTMTAKSMPYKRGFGPYAPEVYRLPSADPFRWPSGPARCAAEAAQLVERTIETQLGADQVACVVIEPIAGEGGFVVPAPGFLPWLAGYCRDRGIVLVADEVQTGLGRTGDVFACEHEQVVPDIVVTAKSLAGGLPLAAVTGRAELMDAVHDGGLGGTFGGNPVACAAALAGLDMLRTEDLPARARHVGGLALPRLRALADRHPVVGDVRGRGAMLAVELVRDRGGTTPNREATSAVLRACHREGLLVLSAGSYGNVVRLLPPLVIDDALLDEGLTVLEKAFAGL